MKQTKITILLTPGFASVAVTIDILAKSNLGRAYLAHNSTL